MFPYNIVAVLRCSIRTSPWGNTYLLHSYPRYHAYKDKFKINEIS